MSDDAPLPTSAARSEDIVPDRARPDPSADALADQGLAERLALAIDLFIDPAVWIDPGPPPETLALALIDTAYAPGASHRIVEGIQRRYRQWAVEHRDELLADLDGPEGILRLFGPGPEATVHIGGVTRHVLTRHTLYGRPKDQMLREAAEVLMGLRILDLEDLRRLDSRPGEDEWLTAVWCSQRGLGQGTLAHLNVLAGVRPFVLTDTVRRWLAGALRELGGASASVRDLRDAGPVVERAILLGARRLAARKDFQTEGVSATPRGLALTMGRLQRAGETRARARHEAA